MKVRIDGFHVVNTALLVLFAAVVFYPFYYMLIYSLNVGEKATSNLYLWPNDFTWENYAVLLRSPFILNAYTITVLRTVVGTAVSVFFTGLWAYGMADSRLIHRNLYKTIATVPMFFGGGLIPYYMLIRELRLIDTFAVYIVTGIYVIWHMILMRTFFQHLHPALEESAKIDGASDFGVYFRIIFPVSMLIIATITLFTAVNHWNAWFDAFNLVNDPALHPIQLFLKTVIQQNIGIKNLVDSLMDKSLDAETLRQIEQIRVTNESLKAAATVITIGPIIFVYPFLQKYFVKGFMVGSIKG